MDVMILLTSLKPMLFVNVQIVNSNGKSLDPTDIVAPTNLFLHSLFSKVEVKLNGKQVCSMNNRIYPYRAMLETLLSYGSDAKSSHLESELYYKDTAGGNGRYEGRQQECWIY